MCDCQGKTYNIAMCCEPQIKLGPIENYYTKPTIDRMLEVLTNRINELQARLDECCPIDEGNNG